MNDDEREAQIRKSRDDSAYYAMSPPRSPDEDFLLRRLDEARTQIARDHRALIASLQRFVALNSEGNAHAEHLCRQALAALADENGAVEAPQSQG